ncbi:sphingomyelin phosphodiesterase 5-like [Ischnura elegans]|uniref:sphingomyelin phosphodiesterase 5-like n=1 Tax=Ischnura elegans TaxID=197161 RepID=UPI001ED8AFB8|nr:sphingomyelin phosphodiesterase 5-like [Ischnura elegans]
MHRSQRYSNSYLKVLDTIAYALLFPWVTAVSLFLACYISNIIEKLYPQKKLIQYFVLGPFFAALTCLLLPMGVLGALIWIWLCTFTEKEAYSYCIAEEYEWSEGRKRSSSKCMDDVKDNGHIFTFASANVLLGPDFLNKLNHNTSGFKRCGKIGEKLTNHNGKYLSNLMVEKKEVGRRDFIFTEFPSVDFLCLQEVWERFHASVLLNHLSSQYGYFIYDVGEYSFKSNLCLLGSGLMFASKMPILEAEFKPFSFRTNHAKFTSLGVLCVKVLLNYCQNGDRHVGIIANLHTQAFQGFDAVIYSQLSEALEFIENFKEKNLHTGDIVKFDIVCGDFNADNISPGDEDVQNHPIFDEYVDPCVEKPGKDKSWSIGTELRQMTLFSPNISTPELFKEALIDDSLRRLYVLDADVVIHRPSLMTAVVQPDWAGRVKPQPYGGMRRVDKIIMHKSTKTKTLGYGFVTALTHLTDHLPVCMTIQTEQ